jgi:hypothetical protein
MAPKNPPPDFSKTDFRNFFPLPSHIQEIAELFILQQADFPLPPPFSPSPDFFGNRLSQLFPAHSRTREDADFCTLKHKPTWAVG